MSYIPIKTGRVADSTTSLKSILPIGATIYDVDAKKTYKLTANNVAADTIATLLAANKIVEVGGGGTASSGLEKITEGTSTGYAFVDDDRTLKVNIGRDAVDMTHTTGGGTVGASGQNSTAIGNRNLASGFSAHAEGQETVSSGGHGSHAEGHRTKAIGSTSHSEGEGTEASGSSSHSEGYNTNASGTQSHAEGNTTFAEGNFSHSTGKYTEATGESSYAGGLGKNFIDRVYAGGKGTFVHQHVGINLGGKHGSAADYSAILGGTQNDLSSSAIGAIVLGGREQSGVQPNVVYLMGTKYWSYTTTQITALPTPEAGTVVYDNTKKKLQLYNGTTWVDIGGSTGVGTVTSFNTRTGAVVPASGDYDIPKIIGLQPALDAKAPIAAPTFTGVARAETPGAGTNTTQIATTAFVKRDFVDVDGDTMTGNLTITSGATNMFRLNASVGKTIAMGTDGNMLPEFSITGSPANDYVFNLFTDPAGGAPNAWSLKFKIADGNLGLTDQAGSAITPVADEDLANKKYVDDHTGGITEQPAIPDLPTLTSTPTDAEFDDIINKINTTLATLRTAGIIAT